MHDSRHREMMMTGSSSGPFADAGDDGCAARDDEVEVNGDEFMRIMKKTHLF